MHGLRNLIYALVIAVLAISASLAWAQEGQESTVLYKAAAAAAAVGIAGIAAGIAIAMAGSAAASAIAERREAAGTLLIIVALGEGIAIYGFLVALLIILLL
ncbi:MAG: hypothetical protein QXP76_05355 [Acidilobaceae archaeon]